MEQGQEQRAWITFYYHVRKGLVEVCQDCGRLHEFLQMQSEEMFWLRKQITNLEGCIRSERLDKRKLVKEKKADRARAPKKVSRHPKYKTYALQ